MIDNIQGKEIGILIALVLMVCILLFAMINGNIFTKKDSRMNKASANKKLEYSWGSICANELMIGLSIDKHKYPIGGVLNWSWALKNISKGKREVVVENDLDHTFRTVLEFFSIEADSKVQEYASDKESITSSGVVRTVDLPQNETVQVESNSLVIDEDLEPGKYRIRARFGGEGFDFECFSDELEIEIE